MIGKGWIPVWKRNRDVFLNLFLVNFFLPLLEPLFYLFAFGFGLGSFVNEVDGMPYRSFIIPGIITMSTVNSCFFYTTYSSFVKMHYQKTFDAIIATPVSFDEVVAGEIAWGATRGLISGVMVSFFFVAIGMVRLKTAVLFIPLVAALSFTFSSLGMFFTAVTNDIESFNYPIFLYFVPMTFFSGTFFPLANVSDGLLVAIKVVFPLTSGVDAFRGLYKTGSLLYYGTGMLPLIHGAVFFALSIALMRKKLIK